jgi:hypothetical protein
MAKVIVVLLLLLFVVFANSWGDSSKVAYSKVGGPLAELIMRMTVSLSVLGVACYIIVSHAYTVPDKNWAYGAVGMILGFWLKGSK